MEASQTLFSRIHSRSLSFDQQQDLLTDLAGFVNRNADFSKERLCDESKNLF